MTGKIKSRNLPEVGTANRQDQLVGRKVMLPTRECDINKLFLMTEVFSSLEKALMMIVPFEQEFFFVFNFGTIYILRKHFLLSTPTFSRFFKQVFSSSSFTKNSQIPTTISYEQSIRIPNFYYFFLYLLFEYFYQVKVLN